MCHLKRFPSKTYFTGICCPHVTIYCRKENHTHTDEQSIFSGSLEVNPPSRFLQPGESAYIRLINEQLPEPCLQPVQILITLLVVVATFVAPLGQGEVKKCPPIRILAQDVGIPNNDQEGLGSGDGNIEPLGVGQESKLVLAVCSDILWRTPDSGDDDDPPFLALELLCAPHHHILIPFLLQLVPDLLNLSSVWCDHPNLLWQHLILSHLQDLPDIIQNNHDLLNIEKAWTCLLLQILANDSMEHKRNFLLPGVFCESWEVETTLSHPLISTGI